MPDFFRHLFNKPEPDEDADWGRKIDQLNDQFDDINSQVQDALETESPEYLLPAFDRVESDMPKLIKELESLPPKSKRLRHSQALFIQAAKTYISSCQCFRKSLEEDDKQAFRQGIKLMIDTRILMEESKNVL